MKTEHALQKKAVRWARVSLWGLMLGMTLISLATPLMSERIFDKWFSLPNFFFLLPIPLLTLAVLIGLEVTLQRLPQDEDRRAWLPFAGGAVLFVLGFAGLAYSFFPYIVPDKITVWDAASSPEALGVILAGVAVVLPCIIVYTVFAYRVFWGKVRELSYD
jgi:cytochrome d ubiquinol oxidase subunit II